MKLSDLQLEPKQRNSIATIVSKWMKLRKIEMDASRGKDLVGEFYSFIKRLNDGKKRIYEIEQKKKQGTITEEEVALHHKLMNWYQALLMLVSFMYHYLSVYMPENEFYRLSVDLFGE